MSPVEDGEVEMEGGGGGGGAAFACRLRFTGDETGEDCLEHGADELRDNDERDECETEELEEAGLFRVVAT